MDKKSQYTTIEIRNSVAVVRFERDNAMNALNIALVDDLIQQLEWCDGQESICCIVLTGKQRVFAAGADINEMLGEDVWDMKRRNQFRVWDRIRWIRKPIIAAVNGYALGGGCELALACDLIIAGEDARFGQPEIKLGVMPGAGGTQRLTRAVGKARALEILLTGDQMTAEEALRAGLVNRVVPSNLYLEEAVRLAEKIASQAPFAVQLIKESVYKGLDMNLQEGMEYERNCFYMLFASEDRTEGIQAFLEKRKPKFQGK